MSDALALVVSEERGEITVAVGGRLSTPRDAAEKYMQPLFQP